MRLLAAYERHAGEIPICGDFAFNSCPCLDLLLPNNNIGRLVNESPYILYYISIRSILSHQIQIEKNRL